VLPLGKSLWHLQEPDGAAECWRQSIVAGRAIGARKYVAGSLLMLGLAAQQAGDTMQAYELCSECLGIFLQIQHDAGIAYALAGLAGVLAQRNATAADEAAGRDLVAAAGVLAVATRLRAQRRMLQDDVEQQHCARIVAAARRARRRGVCHGLAQAKKCRWERPLHACWPWRDLAEFHPLFCYLTTAPVA
jgi:hypothetical protein